MTISCLNSLLDSFSFDMKTLPDRLHWYYYDLNGGYLRVDENREVGCMLKTIWPKHRKDEYLCPFCCSQTFCFCRYAAIRFGEYFRRKEEFLALWFWNNAADKRFKILKSIINLNGVKFVFPIEKVLVFLLFVYHCVFCTMLLLLCIYRAIPNKGDGGKWL